MQQLHDAWLSETESIIGSGERLSRDAQATLAISRRRVLRFPNRLPGNSRTRNMGRSPSCELYRKSGGFDVDSVEPKPLIVRMIAVHP